MDDTTQLKSPTKSQIKSDTKVNIMAYLSTLMTSGDWLDVIPDGCTDEDIMLYEEEHKFQIERIAKLLGMERY